MRSLPFCLVAAIISTCCSVGAVPSPPTASKATGNASVTWFQCPKNCPAPVECGRIHVPLDHANPNGETVPLLFTRLPSKSNSSTSSGLYLENGGPGAQNTVVACNLASEEAAGKSGGPFEALRSAYDIVGLDMRGTGASVPVTCDHNAMNRLTWPAVKDEASYEDMVARSEAFGRSCVNMTGPLIYHMGTNQAIQDLDLLRQALGDKKLNYLGFSYGSQFGSEYAEMFPDKVGRMVLDGVADNHLVDEVYLTAASVGLESTFDDFFRWCNTTSDCALYGRDAAAIFDSVVAASSAGTLHAQSCSGGLCNHNGTADVWEMILISASNLHDYNIKTLPENWYNYAEGLKEAYDNGNGSFFVSGPVTTDSSSSANTLVSQYVISCSDRPERRLTQADYKNIYTLLPVLAPHSLGYSIQQQTVSVCSGWPIISSNPPHNLDPHRMNQLPPIMLVNAFYDPATTSPQGLAMRSQIPTAFSIYRNGGGHTSYGKDGATTQAINAFLLNGTIPAEGTVYPS